MVTLVLGRCLGPLCNLLLTRLDHCWGVLVRWVQLRPSLGIGDGLFLLTIEILIGIGHPHIPLRLVLALLPDRLQHINGSAQGLISLIVRVYLESQLICAKWRK